MLYKKWRGGGGVEVMTLAIFLLTSQTLEIVTRYFFPFLRHAKGTYAKRNVDHLRKYCTISPKFNYLPSGRSTPNQIGTTFTKCWTIFPPMLNQLPIVVPPSPTSSDGVRLHTCRNTLSDLYLE